MEKYNKYHESLDIDCGCNKPKNTNKKDCCCEGLSSQDNSLEILVRQLKREVKELMKTTTSQLLCQDKKIAETMVYIKNNLSNSIRSLLDDMLADGELEEIITETISDSITDMQTDITNLQNDLQDVKDDIAETKEDIEGEVKVHFPYRTNNSGDCQIIETKEHVVMIDVGHTATQTELINYLRENNINRINYLILSHYHLDHVGGSGAEGVIELLESPLIDTSTIHILLPHGNINFNNVIEPNNEWVNVKNAYNTLISYLNLHNINYSYPEENDELLIDDVKFRFNNLKTEYFNSYYSYLYDCYNDYTGYSNYNNFSMTTLMIHHSNRFLFSGDVEELAQSKIYSNFPNIDVYKVEHHSLNLNTNEEYLNRITPKYSVIQNYRSTASDLTEQRATTNKLSLCSTLFSSNESGTVVITSTKYDLVAKCEKKTINNNETYNLISGIALKPGMDLDELFSPGIYYSKNANVTAQIDNTPENFSGFKLVVEKLTYGNMYRQTFIASNSNGQNVYTRCTFEGTYGKWVKMTTLSTGEKLTEGADLNDYLAPMTYYTTNSSVTETILNKPESLTTSFVLINQYINYNAIKQIIYPNTRSHVFYMRNIQVNDGIFREWGVYTGVNDSNTVLLDLDDTAYDLNVNETDNTENANE